MRNLAFFALLQAAVVSCCFASSAPAAAGDWCSFHLKAQSLVDCGYSTYAECHEKSDGKNAICIPDPDHAELTRRPVNSVG